MIYVGSNLGLDYNLKIKKNIYRYVTQVTFVLYGHFKCLQALYLNKLYLPSTVLLNGFKNSMEALKPTE